MDGSGGHESSPDRHWPQLLALIGRGLHLRVQRRPGFGCWSPTSGRGTLTVIDGFTHKVLATVPLGKRPRGLKVSPDGKLLYVALSGSPIAGPGVDEQQAAAGRQGRRWHRGSGSDSLKLLRVLRGVSDPEQLAVSADGKRLFVASEDTGRGIVAGCRDRQGPRQRGGGRRTGGRDASVRMAGLSTCPPKRITRLR